jgi:hypothetical protein
VERDFFSQMVNEEAFPVLSSSHPAAMKAMVAPFQPLDVCSSLH